MNIKIHTHQLDMSDPLREYAERHIAGAVSTIFKRQGSAATLNIEFSDAGGREKQCKVTFFVPQGKTLVATAQDSNPYAAVDLAANKISNELKRYKEKRFSHKGSAPQVFDQFGQVESDFDDYEENFAPIDDYTPPKKRSRIHDY